MATPDPAPANPAAPAEPALLFALLSAVLGLLAALHVGHLTTDQTGAIMIIVNAVFGAVVAALTRPVSPAAFTGAFSAIVAAVASFGLHLSPQVTGASSGLIMAFVLLVARGHVAPVVNPTLRR
jgi:small basic protein